MQRSILVFADDLTGALEIGAKFADRGLPARVTTCISPSSIPPVPVFVIDTETRHLPRQQAADRVRDAAKPLPTPWLVYKKTDSTLRGHIAAELQALLEAFPNRRLIYAPAYPLMGRTVKDGKLYVYGEPVHESAFGCDPLHPIRDNDIHRLLDGIPAVIVDGESNTDIHAAAEMVMQSPVPVIAAGPAALAEALAEMLQKAHSTSGYQAPALQRCLVVNGSLHPVSAQQIALAETRGCFQNGWRLLTHETASAGHARSSEVGECVKRAIAAEPVDALIVFGGDTAFGIHRALGEPMFELYGELVPGVPLSYCGGIHWITKAGGFGNAETLCDIQKRLI